MRRFRGADISSRVSDVSWENLRCSSTCFFSFISVLLDGSKKSLTPTIMIPQLHGCQSRPRQCRHKFVSEHSGRRVSSLYHHDSTLKDMAPTRTSIIPPPDAAPYVCPCMNREAEHDAML